MLIPDSGNVVALGYTRSSSPSQCPRSPPINTRIMDYAPKASRHPLFILANNNHRNPTYVSYSLNSIPPYSPWRTALYNPIQVVYSSCAEATPVRGCDRGQGMQKCGMQAAGDTNPGGLCSMIYSLNSLTGVV